MIINIFQKTKKLSKGWWLLIWPVVVGILLGVAFFSWKNQDSEFNILSPLGTVIPSLKKPKSEKEIIGFLPYWNVPKLDPDTFDWTILTQIIFFGLSIDEQGELIYVSKGEKDLGAVWLEGQSLEKILKKARQNQVKTLLVIKSFDNETIDSIINNQEFSQKAIENIRKKVKEKNFDGINLDFEYILDGKIVTQSAQNLVRFTKDLNIALKRDNPQAVLSIDVYPNGFMYEKPYDVVSLSKVCDQIIIMAYDFHQMGSNQAGPVAPLRAPLGSRSIIETLQVAFEKEIPSEKLILGIPLYGYEWQTVSEEHQANTYPRSGALATFKRVKDLISQEGLATFWDNLSMSPWLVFEEEEELKQIYFENERSISLKLELSRQSNLGGIAFWALGYEGQDASFWQMIKDWQER